MEAAKDKIRKFCAGVGLPIFGVTGPEPLSELESILTLRREQGLESFFEKNWDLSNRCRPEDFFPGLRSIICVGLPYYSVGTDSTAKNERPTGVISRFARGRDYHLVMREKLGQVGEFLRECWGPKIRYWAFVDANPLLEKALASRAGIGWYGKNCLLFAPGYGSWFYLGELFTDLSLPADTPVQGDCGSCTVCIDSCPTGALSPYDLDAGRCISCISQSAGDIPPEIRPKMGKQLYGCDICQEVCPRNQQRSREYPLTSKADRHAEVDLLDLLSMPASRFAEEWRDTTVRARARNILRRNAAVALGNTASPTVIENLSAALQDPSPSVRRHSRWAVDKLGRGNAKSPKEGE